jgi:hypothetical protein
MAARHDEQAGLQRAEPAQVLQVQRQQDHRTEHRQEPQGHQGQGQAVGAVPEGTQVHQRHTGTLQRELADHENRDGRDPGDDDADAEPDLAVAFTEETQAIHQAAEAERRHGHAEPVHGAHLRLADVVHLAQPQHGHHSRDRQDDHEQQPPGADLQDQTGHGRSQRGRH